MSEVKIEKAQPKIMFPVKVIKETQGYKIGTILYLYTGCTYGVISKEGVAVTEIPDKEPFFEIPKDCVEEV